MTRRSNARLAGWAFLLYIATGIISMILFGQASHGDGTASTLQSLAQHASLVRVTVLLTMLTFLYAVVLGVTLYALTRDQDRDLAMIAMCCRLTEGVLAAFGAVNTLRLLSVATASLTPDAPDMSTTQAFGALLLSQGSLGVPVTATCFAVASLIFSCLFLRARSIPVLLAWLGVVASVLLVVCLSLQIAGVLRGPILTYVWIPMAAFEVSFGIWLIVKGVNPSMPRVQSAD